MYTLLVSCQTNNVLNYAHINTLALPPGTVANMTRSSVLHGTTQLAQMASCLRKHAHPCNAHYNSTSLGLGCIWCLLCLWFGTKCCYCVVVSQARPIVVEAILSILFFQLACSFSEVLVSAADVGRLVNTFFALIWL